MADFVCKRGVRINWPNSGMKNAATDRADSLKIEVVQRTLCNEFPER